MTDSEGEIEYLDEDAEIVQQCIQSLPTASVSTMPEYFQPRPSLMVERRTPQKRPRVKRKEEDDSEYEPSDEPPPSPPSPPQVRKRPGKPIRQQRNYQQSPNNFSYLKINKYPHLYQPTVQELLLKRKTMNIHIPDYDDPLCLPVRAIKAEDSDRKRLTNWNNVCLEHFKHCDTLLKPEEGNIKSSVRTALFKNAVNKQTGQIETSIWSKVCVENKYADKKSEIFQCVLPRYREKRALPTFPLAPSRPKAANRTVTEVILSKENHSDGEALVVYKPQDSVSAVYALIDKRKKLEDSEESPPPDEETKLFLKELTACRLCAACYQTSWRGLGKLNTKCVVCPVCGRACVSAYNLLAHFRTHAARHLRRYRRVIAGLLAEIVGYHYRCRVCRRKFDSIRALRAHVAEHQGKEKFTCSVCNRLVNES